MRAKYLVNFLMPFVNFSYTPVLKFVLGAWVVRKKNYFAFIKFFNYSFLQQMFCLLSWCLLFSLLLFIDFLSTMEWFPYNWKMTGPQLTKGRPKYPLLVSHERQLK